ncbi:MAG: PadR family transcriptional regulator [Bryobacteraceae bacterium]
MNDLVLLAALLGGPAYGYALKRSAGLIFGNSAMHNNVVYPSLKKFMRNGWVEQSSVPGERGQQRKQYRITAAGKDYLLEQLSTFGEREAADDGAFLFRVAFFDVLPKAKREAIIAARKSFLASRAGQLSELREIGKPRSFGSVALDRVQSLVEDELRWIERLERELETKKGDLGCRPILTRRATARRS